MPECAWLVAEKSVISGKIDYTEPSMKQRDAVRQLFEDPGFQVRLSALGFFVMDLVSGKAIPSSLWQTLGYGSEPMIGRTIMDLVHPDDAGHLADEMEALLAGNVDNLSRTFRLQRRDGTWTWLEVSYTILSWLGIPLIANNEVLGLMALDSTIKDFYTLRHQRIAEMVGSHMALAMEKAFLYSNVQNMANTDSLTGIGNRHSLRIQGSLIFEHAKANQKNLTFLMADLDHFKELNDCHGHDAGDVVLSEAAAIMSSRLRSQDLFIRYGGEEFLAILSESDSASSWEIAERIRCSLHNHRFTGITRKVSVSIGMHSAVPGPEDTLSGFISAADKALYKAKAQGRDKVMDSCD